MDARRYVIADMEATGLGPERQIIEVALLTFRDGKLTDVYETLVNPLVPLPVRIQELTLIHPRELETAPKLYEIAEAIHERLHDATFVSHNVAFDWPMLAAPFEQMGLPLAKTRQLCTLQMAQELVPGLKDYTLEALCKFFRIKAPTRHRAMPDARATLELFKALDELRAPYRPGAARYFMPEHEAALKDIPKQAGVLRFFDAPGAALRVEACEDMRERAEELLNVRPETRELRQACARLEHEPTGSALIAGFLRGRAMNPRWRWMISLARDEHGRSLFQLERFRPDGRGRWFFEAHAPAKQKLKGLEAQYPRHDYAYREGGPDKGEVLEHNRVVENLLKETRFPEENLLLWGPGRRLGEWSYVLVRGGRLFGWGHDEIAPEAALVRPEAVIHRRTGRIPTEEILAIRYLREHRENRHKRDQWRALKEKTC